MKIRAEQAGRRFNREWIFRNLDYEFNGGSSYAILGINGSGKSTLLQVLAGSLTTSEGKVSYQNLTGENIDAEDFYQHISLAAPYLELIEEFTLEEVLGFHFRFKKRKNHLSNQEITEILGMKKNLHKPLKYFSSGMKQRVKLALAFCSDTPVLLLDEPASNLDEQGIAWYHQMIEKFSKECLTIICSNQLQEYEFCDYQLKIGDFK